MELRPLLAGDRPHLARMLEGISEFSASEVSCALELVDLALGQPAQLDYLFCVAAEGETLCGYVCYGPTPMTAGTFDLYWIASDPGARGKGVGSRLVASMEADLRTRGARLVRVETSAQEAYGPTRAFYERNRYIETARIPEFYKPGDDLVILTKRLA
ncbi:MAG: GNAT family N-acetyltransferase [Deltaproteobacteria bacterium]|nr:GNAT family N-acetyltransferase [Deltaproteobacteria bacterium]